MKDLYVGDFPDANKLGSYIDQNALTRDSVNKIPMNTDYVHIVKD